MVKTESLTAVNNLLTEASARLDELFHAKIPEKIDILKYGDPGDQQFVRRINQLIDFFYEIANFVTPLAQGDLPAQAPQTKNFLSSPLQDLYSQLLHFTWQAKQVANGDYSQRLTFLGELADAFNALIISLEQKENILITLVRTDSLTGIHNRQSLNDILASEIYRSRRYQNPLSIILLDVDHFKHINDNFGHQTGDFVLKTLAAQVRNHIRNTDHFGRWGGEEFLLVAPETSHEQGFKLAEKIRHLIATHEFREVPRVTVSLGLATYHPEDTFDSLIHRADQSLYRAKNAGRNRVEAGQGS